MPDNGGQQAWPETQRHEGTFWASSRVMSKQDNVTAVIANRAQRGERRKERKDADGPGTLGIRWYSVLAVCFYTTPPPSPPWAICTKMQMKTSQLTASKELEVETEMEPENGSWLNENAGTGHRLPSGRCPLLVLLGQGK